MSGFYRVLTLKSLRFTTVLHSGSCTTNALPYLALLEAPIVCVWVRVISPDRYLRIS